VHFVLKRKKEREREREKGRVSSFIHSFMSFEEFLNLKSIELMDLALMTMPFSGCTTRSSPG
jgi:hypothetical protein